MLCKHLILLLQQLIPLQSIGDLEARLEDDQREGGRRAGRPRPVRQPLPRPRLGAQGGLNT